MIELKVEGYCDNCDRFKPDVSMNKREYADPFDLVPIPKTVVTTIICCSHAKECEYMYRYIRDRYEKGNKDGTNKKL